ncbi:MAG: ATP-binding protein [Sphingomonadales bacterium]|nr:ATP-binding protein [Sphingomonadales bacterium]
MAPPQTHDDWTTLYFEATQIFSPSAPVDEGELFAGRSAEISKLIEAILERGKHVILYGERGVGKTSLAQVFRYLFPSIIQKFKLIREQVDPSDDFSSIWRKIFKDINVSIREEGVEQTISLADLYDKEITPGDVRREISRCFKASDIPVIVIDEFDKSRDDSIRQLTANLIKALSDYSANITILIVGVADDISELFAEHESISRCVEQVSMPRMSNNEMKEIIQKRLPRLGMKIDPDALWKIVTLSRGLPSYVHLLGLYATQDTIEHRRKTITERNVDAAIKRSLERSQESIQREYASAVHTNRQDTLFTEVLLACALAQTDDRGLFAPNAVVPPLSKILNRSITIANFQNHLKKFISEERGRILIRLGKERAYKFRFRDPMMQPYVIMKGVEDEMLEAKSLDVLSSPAQPQLPI